MTEILAASTMNTSDADSHMKGHLLDGGRIIWQDCPY